MNIKKSLRVIFVDFLGLLIGVLNGFLLPKYFSIGDYAYLKTFTLYTSYAGMFHFGFCDGMYIILGGKDISDIKKEKIKSYFYIMLKIVGAITLVLLVMSLFFIKDIAFKYFVYYILPFQVVLFISLLYRATGEFDKYIIVRIATNFLNLISTVIVILVIKSPVTYMRVQVAGYIAIALVCSALVISSAKKVENTNLSEVKAITAMGFSVMIANTVNNVFLSLDRWFVKIKFTVEDFAYYSFAVSMLSLFLVLINSVTVLFYPYLARNDGDEKVVAKVKKYIVLICSFAPAGYFVLDFIVRTFIKKYIMSLDVVGILIMCIPFITLTNVLYANLYKVKKRGKDYLIVASMMVGIAFILDFFVAYVLKNSIWIAYATLISLIIWYVYSSEDFKGLKIQKREILHFAIYILAYNVIKEIPIHSLIKVFIFLAAMAASEYVIFKDDFKEMIKLVANRRGSEL